MVSFYPVTVQVPESLYDLLRQRAAEAARTVQEELLDALGKQLAADESTADRMRSVLKPMDQYVDSQLWEVARTRLSAASNERSQELNDKQREIGLSPAERVELESLLTQYEWHVLLRSKALAILKNRGHDISPLITSPPTVPA